MDAAWTPDPVADTETVFTPSPTQAALVTALSATSSRHRSGDERPSPELGEPPDSVGDDGKVGGARRSH